jgi:hypothetical protein
MARRHRSPNTGDCEPTWQHSHTSNTYSNSHCYSVPDSSYMCLAGSLVGLGVALRMRECGLVAHGGSKKAFITLCSPVVPLLSTSKADSGLASEFRWDRAIYTAYERMLKEAGRGGVMTDVAQPASGARQRRCLRPLPLPTPLSLSFAPISKLVSDTCSSHMRQ